MSLDPYAQLAHSRLTIAEGWQLLKEVRAGARHKTEDVAGDGQGEPSADDDGQGRPHADTHAIETAAHAEEHGPPSPEEGAEESPMTSALARAIEDQQVQQRASRLRGAERRPPPVEPIWLTKAEAAELLRCSPRQIQRYFKLPGFPVMGEGKGLRIDRKKLLVWADEYFAARQEGRPFQATANRRGMRR